MAWDVVEDPLRFEEAEDWFRERVPLTREDWDALDLRARQRAFTVSHLAHLDLVARVQRSLEEALIAGETFESWKLRIGPQLERAWGTQVRNPAWRLETIFRNNVQHAYSAGRYEEAAQMFERLTLAEEFVEFLTLPAYDYVVAHEHR